MTSPQPVSLLLISFLLQGVHKSDKLCNQSYSVARPLLQPGPPAHFQHFSWRLIVLIWAATGPCFHFNDIWQLVINTGTTIVTFLMVFLIQHTQNADTAAIHIKLDEPIRATQGANSELLNLEEMDQSQLEEVRARYESLATTAAHLQSKKERCMPADTAPNPTPPSPAATGERQR